MQHVPILQPRQSDVRFNKCLVRGFGVFQKFKAGVTHFRAYCILAYCRAQVTKLRYIVL